MRMVIERLPCFMCNSPDLYNYSKDEISKIERHLKFKHKVDHGVTFLVAGWFMTEEEREAITNLKSEKRDVSFGEIDNEALDEFEEIYTTDEDNITSPSSELDANLEQNEIKTEDGFLVDGSDNLPETENADFYRRRVKKESKGRKEKLFPIIVGSDEVAGGGRVCRVCGVKFSDPANMKRHFKDVHQPGEFPCKGCGKVYTSFNKHLSHYSRYCGKYVSGKNTEKDQFQCKACHAVYTTKHILVCHYARCTKRTSPRKRSITY